CRRRPRDRLGTRPGNDRARALTTHRGQRHMSTLRLLLADDHALVRAGMLALRSELPGVTVVAEAGDGREALRLIRERKRDIALLDISMPGLNGMEISSSAM